MPEEGTTVKITAPRERVSKKAPRVPAKPRTGEYLGPAGDAGTMARVKVGGNVEFWPTLYLVKVAA